MNMTDYTWTSADGLKLFARVWGERGRRAPVICIPGLTRNSRDFDEVAPWMAGQGRQVYAVDLRGRGRSARDPDPSHYNPRTYADDVAGLLRSIGAPKALFVGTSLGGVVTFTLAARHGGCIAAAVINDVGPQVPAAAVARISSYVGKAPAVASWNDAAQYCRMLNGEMMPHYAAADWERMSRRLFVDDGSGKPVLDYDAAIFRPVARWQMRLATPLVWMAWKRLARSVPVLLLRGANSDVLPAQIAARMQRASPNVTLAEVPGVGHAPMLDEPAARAAIEAFLARAP
jgi:pimeloyl-ACP methyl ester carboxylesterase